MAESGGWVGARRLLKRLRDIMAGGGSAQDRLDRIVRVIAADLVAEVCSVYVLRAGEVLELFATEGLKPEAVHRTRLRVGEGLVGDVAAHARPINLADAQSHPKFAYRPETGEEVYHSLVGVPVQRDGRVLGVLVVQNRTRRTYTDEEVETLETVAMVLAETIATGDLVDPAERAPTDGIAVLPLRLDGMRINEGVAIGRAVLHHRRVQIREVVAEDPQAELARLDAALATLRSSLDDMIASPELAAHGEPREVLEAYRLIAGDKGWTRRLREAALTGLSAEAAVQKVQNDARARMGSLTDAFFRERLAELDDLGNRLLIHLGAEDDRPRLAENPDDMIIVARELGPAELLDYDRRKLKGLVLEGGAPTSHVAIIARALNIPVVGRVGAAFNKIDMLDPLIVDGDNGIVFVRPAEDIVQSFDESVRLSAERSAAYAAARELPAVSLDGERVALNINAGLLIDMPHLLDSGADGIGLYRTELPFMMRDSFPTVEEQANTYGRVLDLAGGRPVIFRTLDIGGDKALPYLPDRGEENPAMGWRSIRIGLDRPAMLRQQLRALVRAAAGRDLHIMFPMIAEAAELESARRVLALELERESARGTPPPRRLRVGAMLEVPSLVFQIAALAGRVDFVSIGSNDLLQFLFAVDRTNQRLADRYDLLAPPSLAMFRRVIVGCKKAGIDVGLCGEAGSRPLEAMALVGLGLRSLSLAPHALGPVKMMIRSLRVRPLEAYLKTVIGLPDHTLREKLRGYARDHGVVI
ncbi:MAG TPA: phosphoenolpyruvate--protein phosphotransferase [Alphaproteobacteria bacterium]|nr:phosphoenolpyruvate--protein phosphotransferase [Alphaproteobacteria bacterium]